VRRSCPGGAPTAWGNPSFIGTRNGNVLGVNHELPRMKVAIFLDQPEDVTTG